jgi:ubiquinone biosynthesis protein COQ9
MTIETKPCDIVAVQKEILQATLKFVPTYSFSDRAIMEAVKSLGYPDTTHRLFKDGPLEIVSYLCEQGVEAIRTEHELLT